MSRSLRAAVRLLVLLAGVVIVAVQPGCSGCSERAPLQFVPHDAVSVIVVPKLNTALAHLHALSDVFRKSLISGALVDRQAAMVRSELGFDPGQPATLSNIGVDHEGGLALFFGAKGELGLVLPVANQATLDGTLRRQLSKLLRGDVVFRPGESRGVKLTTVSTRAKQRVGAWAFSGKHAVIGGASHGGADELVGRMCKLERSMKGDNPGFSAARKQLGDSDLFAYVDGGGMRSALAHRSEQARAGASGWERTFVAERQKTGEAALRYFQGLGLGFTSGAKGLELSAYYATPGERLAVLRGILSGRGEAVQFGKLIGPDALIVARASLNPKQLLDRAVELLPASARRRIYERLERMAREESFNLEKDLLPLLSGRFAAAVYPPPPESVRQILRGSIPFAQLAPAVFVAQIEDHPRAAELLTRLERFLVLRGASVRVERGAGDKTIFTLERNGAPVASWLVTKKLFIVATGGRLAQTVELAEKGGENVLARLQSSTARAALKEDEGLLVSAEMARIAETLSAMDLGMEAKLMLAPVMGTLGRFKEITVTASLVDAGLLAKLAVVLQ